jgi:hypothetical protein
MKKSDFRAASMAMRRGETPKGGFGRALYGDCSQPSKLSRRVDRLHNKGHRVRGGGL